MSIIKRCIEHGIKLKEFKQGNTIKPTECVECGEYLPDDARVQAGMKCGMCAYGSERNPETINEDGGDE